MYAVICEYDKKDISKEPVLTIVTAEEFASLANERFDVSFDSPESHGDVYFFKTKEEVVRKRRLRRL